MVSIGLGDKKAADKDDSVTIYDSISITGVADPEAVVQTGLVSKIQSAMDTLFSSNEKYASLVELVNANFNRQSITLSLEFKGSEISDQQIEKIIRNCVGE